MNSIYNFISQYRWIIPVYIFIFHFALFISIKLTYDFWVEGGITFLIQPFFFLACIMLAVYFAKKNNTLLLIFTSFSMWFLVEFVLYKVSPYKSYIEANGGYYYISITAHGQLEHSRKPNQKIFHQQDEFTMNFTTNSLGFRGEDPDSSQIKIIIIGDSYVEGWGVDNDATLNKVLNRKFNCNNCVMNAGVAGSDLVSAYLKLEDLLNKFQPKLVILNINDTDFNDILLRYLANEKASTNIIFEFFYGASFVVRHFSHLFFDVNISSLNRVDDYLLYQKKMNSLIFECLHKYQILLQEKNINFIVFLQPSRDDLIYIQNKASLYPIHVFLEEQHFKFYNAHKDLQEYENYENLFWPKDGHFNNRGSKFYANIVFNKIQNTFNLDSLLND